MSGGIPPPLMGKGDPLKLLKDIATIRAGVPFRGKIEPNVSGQYRLVQIKDISEERPLKPETLIRIDAKEARDHHLLRQGDVLLVARGTRNVAVPFLADVSDAITGSQVFVISPSRNVSAEYLAYYLNQRAAQKYISETLAGSHIPFISKDALNELPVLVPPMEVQRKVSAVQQLALREQELLGQIKELRKHLTTNSLQQALLQAEHSNTKL